MIVETRATILTSDKQQAAAIIEKAIANTGTVTKEVSADAGYCPAQAVEGICALGVGPFFDPERTRHGTRPEPAIGPDTQGTVGQGPDAAEATDQAGA